MRRWTIVKLPDFVVAVAEKPVNGGIRRRLFSDGDEVCYRLTSR